MNVEHKTRNSSLFWHAVAVSVTNEWMESDNPACLEPVPSLEKSNVSTITNIQSVFELSQNIKLSMVFI